MRIAFTSTWQKTDLFALLARRLESHSIQSAWIVTSEQYQRKLIDQGFPEATILYLRKDHALHSRSFQEDRLLMAKMETLSGEFVRNLVQMDRYVGTWPWAKAERYAAYVTARIAEFLDRLDVSFVTGEPSVLHDLLAVMVCKATGRQYPAPFPLRLPVQRVVFWKGYKEGEFFTFGARIPAEVRPEFLRMSREIRDQIVVSRRKPDYFYKNSRAPKITPAFVFKVARGVQRAVWRSRFDANMYSLHDILVKHKLHMRPLHYAAAKARWKGLFEQPDLGARFVLFALHKQPEHSIDVQGARFSNQFEVIRAIAKELPYGTELYVKEHRNCLGDRSVKELRRIKAIPGVRLIDPLVDAHDLVANCEAVVSISGTIALEAALHGKRSLVLCNDFLSGFSTAVAIAGPWEVAWHLARPAPDQDLDYDVQYLGWLLENSFEGILSDPVSSPACVSHENLMLLESAFLQVCRSMEPAGVATS